MNQLASVDYSWRIENGVAIYTKKNSAGVVLSGTGMKIVCSDNVQTEEIFRISGLKSGLTVNADGSIDGLKVDGNQITVSRNVLSTKPVSVNNGYELVLGDDVPVPTLKEESRKVITFGSSSNFMYTSPYTTAGWQIDNGKIIYAPVNGFETFKITGLMKGFDIEKISVNGYTITLPYEVLNGATNVKLSTNFSYTLALGDDCPTVTDNANYWKVNGTNATYYANGKTDGFAVSQNGKDITYTAAVDGNRKISVSGLLENLTSEDLDENISVNGKVINVNPNVVGKNFSVTNGYKIIFDAGNYASNNFVSTLTTDTIENFGDNLKIDVGEGNDKIYTEGNAVTVEGGLGSDSVDNRGDNVKIYGGKDNDTIRTDGDYVTVKGGDGNDYIDNHGDNVLIEGDDKITVLSNGISSSSLVVGKGDDMILTDGENVTINGGKGDDRIISSATSGNVYQYANDDGKDIIWGYSRNDTIQLTDVSSITAVNFNVPAGTKDIVITIGSGSITLKDAAKKSTALTFVDTDGKEISSWRYLPIFAGGVFVNNNTGYIVNAATGAVFSTNTGGDFGNSDGDISNADSTADSDVVIQHLDASLVKVAVKLIGDTDDNSLIGGSGNDTLIGGGGEDTFVGGKGSDLFIHDGGDVTIADYGDGSDKISLGSAFDGFNINGTDLVLNSATGSVTLKDAVGKKITLVENGKSTTEIFASDGKTNSAGTAITLASSTQSFAAADSKLVTIDGSLTSNSTITGNAKSNKIFGGDGDDMLIGMSGNDTLFGGAGSDIFIHDSGKDIILDFNGNEDKIVIGTGKISSSSVNSKGDVVFKIGTDSVTVKKIDGEDISDGKKITITDDDGETSYTYFSEKIVSADGKVTL
ncbi:MAG: hypothetical protein IKP64_05970, partial [Selenomonadaceae bacterium]|nr:hypothetical protein [Selenomonadaceae bacterium]